MTATESGHRSRGIAAGPGWTTGMTRRPGMKNALRRAGLVNKKGKIL
jgi:hypothetical protein